MRAIRIINLLCITLLVACTATDGGEGGGDAKPAVGVTPTYISRAGLSDQERFREAISLLEHGRVVPARKELDVYLQSNPGSEIANDLVAQIDQPSSEYLPADYREVELISGESLSTLAERYLGSIYQFFALAKFNGITDPGSLRAGQMIRIPLTESAMAAFASTESESGPKAADPGPAAGTQEIESVPAVATPAPDVGKLHRKALDAYRAQDLEHAIELWDRVLAIDPDHENARLYRAQARELQRKLRDLL